jgi:hypothetical protein
MYNFTCIEFVSTTLKSDLVCLFFFINSLDNAHCHYCFEVSDSEPPQSRILRVCLHAHRLGGFHQDNGRVPVFDELGVILSNLSSLFVNLSLNLDELACDVCSVAINYWCVSVFYTSRMVDHNHLGQERFGSLGRLVAGLPTDMASLYVFHQHTLNVAANIVTGNTLRDRGVIHLN